METVPLSAAIGYEISHANVMSYFAQNENTCCTAAAFKNILAPKVNTRVHFAVTPQNRQAYIISAVIPCINGKQCIIKCLE